MDSVLATRRGLVYSVLVVLGLVLPSVSRAGDKEELEALVQGAKVTLGLAAGQCGEIGDEVASIIKTGDRFRHFVTVSTGADDKVTFQVTVGGVPETKREEVFKAGFRWRIDGEVQAATTSLTYDISRTMSDKFTVEIVSAASGKTVAGTRWIVWVVDTRDTFTTRGPEQREILDTVSLKMVAPCKVCHKIFPPQILTDPDRPDLEGGTGGVAPPNVGATEVSVYNKGVSLAEGAMTKWDASRQIRVSISAVHVDMAQLRGTQAATYFTSYANYPSDPKCGNDDMSTGHEMNDPYAVDKETWVTGYDKPGVMVYHAGATADDSRYEHVLQFRSFARLLIKDQWYPLSKGALWQVHFKYKRAHVWERTFEADSGWDVNRDDDLVDPYDINGDGDYDDGPFDIWVDNGTFYREDNEE